MPGRRGRTMAAAIAGTQPLARMWVMRAPPHEGSACLGRSPL
jgi:hypothetical protein